MIRSCAVRQLHLLTHIAGKAHPDYPANLLCELSAQLACGRQHMLTSQQELWQHGSLTRAETMLSKASAAQKSKLLPNSTIVLLDTPSNHQAPCSWVLHGCAHGLLLLSM